MVHHDYNGETYTFLKVVNPDGKNDNLLVQYRDHNMGLLIANDLLATEYIYQVLEDDSEYDVNTLKQLYGLSLLFNWANEYDGDELEGDE